MKWFGNDQDGMTAKDFTILASLFTTFGLVIVGAVKELAFEGISTNYIDLVRTVIPVVATAVGGVFGVQAVQSFRAKGSEDHESYK